jgi:hypothetical protein
MIIVPSKETENLKRIAHLIRDKLPAGTRASLVELEADHMNAPEQAKAAIRDWLLAQLFVFFRTPSAATGRRCRFRAAKTPVLSRPHP